MFIIHLQQQMPRAQAHASAKGEMDGAVRECAAGDPDVAQKRLAALKGIALLDTDLRVEKIALGLVSEACVPPNVFEDALHIAIAGVHRMDFILTWNFKHIANPMLQEKIARYLDHCGVTMPYICSPQELLGDDDGSIDG